MAENKALKIWELSLLVALSICLCVGTWAQNRHAALSAGIVRLHVLAVSDAEEEQAVKLQVRDAVLEFLDSRLSRAETSQEARDILEAELGGIRAAALSASGGRQVSVSLGDELYPSREYSGFALPAGRYESLRITLGEGRGKNWWCIVFPPVCLSAVQSQEMEAAMSSDDFALLTQEQGYELRFRTLELWGELLEKMEAKGWLVSGSE